MFLPGNVKGPTALHSWGSQVVGCECGCRTAGFSHETLCSKGLYGILFPVPGDPHPTHPEVPRVRHPHPREVAVLCGVPEMVWPASRRLCLAGLGQQASPGGHLQKHVDLMYTGDSKFDPLELIEDVRTRVCVIAEHLDFCPVAPQNLPEPPVEPSMEVPLDSTLSVPWVHFKHLGGPGEVTVVHFVDPVPFVVKLPDPACTIAAVVRATCELLGLCDSEGRVVDCASGLNLASDQPAAGLCLWICRHADHAAAAPGDEVSPTIPWMAEPADVLQESPLESVVSPVASSEPCHAPLPCRPEPLVSLDSGRLLLVPEPSVPDVATVHALRKQTIGVGSRKAILANQGTLWPDDELCWHVEQLMKAANKHN